MRQDTDTKFKDIYENEDQLLDAVGKIQDR
jgi:hypothetical protein